MAFEIFKNNKNKMDDKNLPANCKYKVTFSRDYIIGIIDIGKISKDKIIKYIRDECIHYLDTEDYYYGYIYEEGLLKYVAHKSDKHDVGKISILSIVLMNQGKFHLVDNENFFIFENTGTIILDKIDFIDDETSENSENSLGENLLKYELYDVPETLILKWSLNKKNIHLIMTLVIVFSMTLIFYAISSQNYKLISEKASMVKKQYLEQQSTKKTVPLPNISEIIKKLSSIIDNQAIVTKTVSEGNKIQIFMKFKNEYEAQTFIKNNGGNYENGQVVFSAIYTDTK